MESKFQLSRRGIKLQPIDDNRLLLGLPRDVSDKFWSDILAKEENDLILFEICEDIVDEALHMCYEIFIQKQASPFTAHCTEIAWLKLIDWHFYRHDPGEDPTAYPPCYIPRRKESWIPDEMPTPSPKDSWAQQSMTVVHEELPEDDLRTQSHTSLIYPVVEDIPPDCWFPGKVCYPPSTESSLIGAEEEIPSSLEVGNDSEVLERVTNYSLETAASKRTSRLSSMKSNVSLPPIKVLTTPADSSLLGGGDSHHRFNEPGDKRKRGISSIMTISRRKLSPFGSQETKMSYISDCRLRSLRVDTSYEITKEDMKVYSPLPGKK